MKRTLMKNALCLSGGGAKGAFQVGAIKCWHDMGIDFDVVAGVSVGSLNGAMVAQDKIPELLEIWNNVTSEDIYVKHSNFVAALRVIFGKKSIYDADPLFRLIQKYIKKADFHKRFYLGVTSLDSGDYTSLTVDDLGTDYDVQSAIFASSLMPILWKPVEIKTASGLIHSAVDGGLRNVTPLRDILSEMPDRIYIVECSRLGGVVDPANPKNIIDIAKRTFMDIMLSEVVDNDVRDLLRINDLVLQAKEKRFTLTNPKNGKEYKYFEVVLMTPPHNLGDPIKFDQDIIQTNIKLGYDMARELVK